MHQQNQIFPYLQRLLNGRPVVWKTLGEVVKTIPPPGKIKIRLYEGNGSVPVIDQGIKLISGYTDDSTIALPSDNYILFGDHSEHIKYVDFSFVQGADGLKILLPQEGIPKYIYYAFVNNYVTQGGYKRHWSSAKETPIPIPPLAEQERIVGILDQFERLTNSLSEGLPREIELRQKQYEYYRDQLLTFQSPPTP